MAAYARMQSLIFELRRCRELDDTGGLGARIVYQALNSWIGQNEISLQEMNRGTLAVADENIYDTRGPSWVTALLDKKVAEAAAKREAFLRDNAVASIEDIVDTHQDKKLHDLYKIISEAKKAEQDEIIRCLQEFSRKLPETIRDVRGFSVAFMPLHGSKRRLQEQGPQRQDIISSGISVPQEWSTTRETTTPPGKRRRLLKKTSERDFAEITLSISESCTTSDLTRIRRAFYKDLLQTLRTDTRSTEVALQFTSFIFEEVLGRGCLDRLIKFCKNYATTTRGEMDTGAARRFYDLASDLATPESVRSFYHALGYQETCRTTRHPLLQHLDQLVYARRFSEAYRVLVNRLDNQDPELISFFQSQDLEVSVGHGWSSVAVDHLVIKSGISRSVLNNTCERAKGIDELVKCFGEGILPLLPPGSMNRLRRLGNGRMRPVYELLYKHLAPFQPICDMVKAHIYEPFLRGVDRLPLMAGALSVEVDVPLLQALRRAVESDLSSASIELVGDSG